MTRDSKKCSSMTFIEADIHHRIEPLQMFYIEVMILVQGRRATHSRQFSAALHNFHADTPWFFSTCEINERRSRPTGRLKPLSGLIPLQLSTPSRRAACAGVLRSSRWMWPNSEWRLLDDNFEDILVRRWMSMLVTKSCYRMQRWRHWQPMWNAWIHQLSSNY